MKLFSTTPALSDPQDDPAVRALAEKCKRLDADLDETGEALAATKARAVQVMEAAVETAVSGGPATADAEGIAEAERLATREAVLVRRLHVLIQAREAVTRVLAAEQQQAAARAVPAWVTRVEQLRQQTVEAEAAAHEAKRAWESHERRLADLRGLASPETARAEPVRVEVVDLSGYSRGEVVGFPPAEAAAHVRAGRARYAERWRQLLTEIGR